MEQITSKQIYEKLIQLELAIKRMDKHFEDLEFARRTEEAYQRHEAGEFKQMDEKEFLKELEKW